VDRAKVAELLRRQTGACVCAGKERRSCCVQTCGLCRPFVGLRRSLAVFLCLHRSLAVFLCLHRSLAVFLYFEYKSVTTGFRPALGKLIVPDRVKIYSSLRNLQYGSETLRRRQSFT
jgi:hypothetical protein